VNNLDREPAIRRMASELGLPLDDKPVEAIVRYCIAKIKAWLRESDGTNSIAALEALVCERLNLCFEEVWDDAQLDAVIQRYARGGDPIFLTLPDDLNEETYATLIRLNRPADNGADRFVAVIDCRGEKSLRRFFTRWHEIAHLLTRGRQLQLVYHRSTRKPPLERLMDHVAGEVGFFDPLFSQALRLYIPRGEPLTFAAVNAIREAFCPDASFQATLIACVKRLPTPAVLVEAGMGLKKDELVKLATPSLFVIDPPKARLRALGVTLNQPARGSRFRIDRNMAIPPASLITKAFDAMVDADSQVGLLGEESLALWRHSNGQAVGFVQIRIETLQIYDHVYALLQPAAVRRRPTLARHSVG
jgi:hypothetical protein